MTRRTLRILLAAAGCTLAAAPAAPAASPDLVVSEVYGGGGNAGAPLANDYVELYNRGAAPVSLGGRSVQYASATGTGAFSPTALPDVSLAPGQHALIRMAGGAGGAPLPAPDGTGSTNLSATAGKVALATGTSSLGCNGGSSPCSPEQRARITDLVGFGSANFSEGAPAPAGSNSQAIRRDEPGCADSDDNARDFAAGDPDPDNRAATGPCPGDGTGDGGGGGDTDPPPPPAERCGDAATTIPAVQGDGARSPVTGERVSVEGVVVGDFQGSSGDGALDGFYLQDPAGDGRSETSDGVFVYDPDETPDVREGDVVRVTGRVTEFARGANDSETLTEIVDVTVTPCERTAELPAAAPLDLPRERAELERLEGMRVSSADELTVTEMFNLRFGEVLLSAAGRLVQPTERVAPGPEAVEFDQAQTDATILLDDGRSGTNFGPVRYTSDPAPLRRGDQVAGGLEGVLSTDFNAFRIQPTGEPQFDRRNPRPPAPEPTGGDVEVGSFNVLNYFLTFGRSEDRGAPNEREFAEQEAKVVAAINGLGSDVVALQEIQDTSDEPSQGNDPDAALDRLVAALNEDAGFGKWAKSPAPQPFGNTDEIRVAQIYQPAQVERIGAPVAFPDEAFVGLARVPIAQTYRSGTERFTVIANHFKSKGCRGASGADADQRDGQSCFNAARVRQSEALLRFVADRQAATDDADVLVAGDLNAYTLEDPVRTLEQGGLENLPRRFEAPEDRYSYVFNGRQGVLDHGLATAPLAAKATGTSIWHINADESRLEEYGGYPELYDADPYRSSDHDAGTLGFDDDVTPTCDGRPATIVGTSGDDVIEAGNGPDVIVAFEGSDQISGGNGEDVICGGTGDDTVRGGNGDDVIDGGPGADDLDGGRGNDRVEPE